jgi:hypothetical protein
VYAILRHPWRKKHEERKMEEEIEIWEKLLSLIKNHLKEISIIPINKNLFLIIEYFRLITLSEEIMGAIKSNLYHSVPIITRSQLETLLDFKNLLNDPDYSYLLSEMSISNQLKILKNYKNNPQNPYLVFLKNNEIDLEINKLELQLSEVKSKHKFGMKIRDKFIESDNKDVYESVYIFFCQDAHGLISVLLSEYLTTNNGNYIFNIEDVHDKNDYYAYYDLNIQLITSTSNDINNIFTIFGSKLINEIINYRTYINKDRTSLSPSMAQAMFPSKPGKTSA